MSKKKASDEPIKDASTQQAPELELAAEAVKDNVGDVSKPSEELKAEKERYLRLAAEYDNYRKRTSKEREAIFSDVRSDTIMKFLPVYDNLSRALAQETADEAYRKGVEMTMTQLKGILDSLGVTEIDTAGKKFDPELHNAVIHIESDKYGDGDIVLEFEKGFKLGNKVIRFSMVQVAN